MGVVDHVVKELLIEGRRDVSAWLLGAEVEDAVVETIELPGESLYADAVFQVQLADGRAAIVHIEIQGRRSNQPMPQRMLAYMMRLAQQHNMPVQSAVLYTEPNAGSQDTGEHTYVGLDGQPFLSWQYQVVHLWKLRAEDVLNLGRRSLVPLVGLTRIERPREMVQIVLSEIHQEPDSERQVRLFTQLMGLVKDEEVIAMIEQTLTQEDIEDMKQYPFLWRSYQAALADALSKQLRESVLEVVAARFDPPLSDYRTIEQALADLDDLEQLKGLLREASQVADVATFMHVIQTRVEQN